MSRLSEGERQTDSAGREKLLARQRAIKVLDYALQNEDGSANCERFVEAQGLSTFFSAFMGRVSARSLSYLSQGLS